MTVLLVEDSAARAMTMADALELEGVEVALAPTAGDAARRLSKLRPDALLLSASRPADKAVNDLLRQARSSCPHMRIVLIQPHLIEELAEFAPDAVLESFAPREVVAVLRRILAA